MTANGVADGRAHFSANIVWTMALLTMLGISAMSSQVQSNNLVTAPIDPASRVVLEGQRPPWALPQNIQSSVPDDSVLEHLILGLKRSPQQQKVFEQFLQRLQDPTSPNYHRWLTPIQVGKRFGAAQHDIDTVSGWLRAQGLRINSVANNRMMIDFSGNASQVGAAFATKMLYYLVKGEQRMAAADDPQIPAALAGVIQSIGSLYTVKDRSYHGAEKHRLLRMAQGRTRPHSLFAMAGLATVTSAPRILPSSMI